MHCVWWTVNKKKIERFLKSEKKNNEQAYYSIGKFIVFFLFDDSNCHVWFVHFNVFPLVCLSPLNAWWISIKRTRTQFGVGVVLLFRVFCQRAINVLSTFSTKGISPVSQLISCCVFMSQFENRSYYCYQWCFTLLKCFATFRFNDEQQQQQRQQKKQIDRKKRMSNSEKRAKSFTLRRIKLQVL